DGGMGVGEFLGGTVDGVEVQRHRAPSDGSFALRYRDGGEAVPGVLGGLEDDAAVERRLDTDDAVVVGARIAVQFQRTAPFGLPARVEIDDQVQAPVPVLGGMAV